MSPSSSKGKTGHLMNIFFLIHVSVKKKKNTVIYSRLLNIYSLRQLVFLNSGLTIGALSFGIN